MVGLLVPSRRAASPAAIPSGTGGKLPLAFHLVKGEMIDSTGNFPPSPFTAGPLLTGLVAAQRRDEAALTYPLINDYARAVDVCACRLGGPLVWPVDTFGERLAGAAVLVSAGRVRVRGWTDPVTHNSVLLVAGF